jgi:hypothetical protein
MAKFLRMSPVPIWLAEIKISAMWSQVTALAELIKIVQYVGMNRRQIRLDWKRIWLNNFIVRKNLGQGFYGKEFYEKDFMEKDFGKKDFMKRILRKGFGKKNLCKGFG